MDIYLPIAEMSVNFLVLLGFGMMGGFVSGLFGIGGGFLLAPLLTLVGIPPSIAVGTQPNQLVGTGLAGTLAHWRKRNIDIRMGLTMLIGSFVGATCGAELFKWLQKIGHINLSITIGYIALLGGIGGMMLFESGRDYWKNGRRPQQEKKIAGSAKSGADETRVLWGGHGLLGMDFPASRLRMSILLPMGVGFISGMMVALLGIGSFMLIPAMIYILRMPPVLVNGTSLFQIIFTSAFATLMQAVLNKSVDVMLGLIVLTGSVIGVPLGTRLASRLNPVTARLLMSLVIVSVGAKLLIDLILYPSQPFTIETRIMQ